MSCIGGPKWFQLLSLFVLAATLVLHHAHSIMLPLFRQWLGSSNSIPGMARIRPTNEEWLSNWPTMVYNVDCEQWFLLVVSSGR